MELAHLSYNTDGHMHMIVSRAPTFNSVADLKGKSHDEIYRVYNGDIQYRLSIENYCNDVIVNNNATIDRLKQALNEKDLLMASLNDINALKKDNDRLTAENAELKAEITRLTEENITLKTDMATLNTKVDNLENLIKDVLIPKMKHYEDKNIELYSTVELLRARL